ncbi:MAG: prepilin-type N-terminal cleavage/methylation domain-containing protein [Candidatus Riflebacteria bacterium]|nr:prepilin-type N-terminal cleavage/methylation domain-containing protein [Candidatus Riflebacteria bacterium]
MKKGITLLEIVIALLILSLGILPIFDLLSQSRRVISKSATELKSMSLALSTVEAVKCLPEEKFKLLPLTEIQEQDLKKYGIEQPSSDQNLSRKLRLSYANNPNLPAERFSNPWGKVYEIAVEVVIKRQSENRSVLTIKAYYNPDQEL